MLEWRKCYKRKKESKRQGEMKDRIVKWLNKIEMQSDGWMDG